jgi:hypothetical protein
VKTRPFSSTVAYRYDEFLDSALIGTPVPVRQNSFSSYRSRRIWQSDRPLNCGRRPLQVALRHSFHWSGTRRNHMLTRSRSSCMPGTQHTNHLLPAAG